MCNVVSACSMACPCYKHHGIDCAMLSVLVAWICPCNAELIVLESLTFCHADSCPARRLRCLISYIWQRKYRHPLATLSGGAQSQFSIGRSTLRVQLGPRLGHPFIVFGKVEAPSSLGGASELLADRQKIVRISCFLRVHFLTIF